MRDKNYARNLGKRRRFGKCYFNRDRAV